MHDHSASCAARPGLTVRAAALCAMLAMTLIAAAPAHAVGDPLAEVLTVPGGAGLGSALRVERSMYRDGGTRNDFVPLYLYEGKVVYVHAYRVGLKIHDRPDSGFDVFLSHRFEGFPYDNIPASLAGMSARQPGFDVGVGYRRQGDWGIASAELLHDMSHNSGGNEMRLGYTYDWDLGKLLLRPGISIAARDARLNNYYYGVLPSEATATRPAYTPGTGTNTSISLFAQYDVTERWRALAGLTATHWSSGVRHSPIVVDRTQVSAMVGLAYDLSPERNAWPDHRPIIVKLEHGKSTDCNLLPIMHLGCTSTSTVDQTRINAIEVGRPFIERLNGWPLDIVGYIGLLQHDDKGLQPNGAQINAYMKAYYYGFPWSERVRTRIGFGAGVSYAQRIPYVEGRDQVARGRSTSKLLNYLDPSIDVSVGDLIGVRAMRDTYAGFGVSHRSGIFGTSQMFGNVDGGSNYIYSYVEWAM